MVNSKIARSTNVVVATTEAKTHPLQLEMDNLVLISDFSLRSNATRYVPPIINLRGLQAFPTYQHLPSSYQGDPSNQPLLHPMVHEKEMLHNLNCCRPI